MKETTIIQFNKNIEFEKGESINILVELKNAKPKQYENIKDFLDTMLKEIKELF